MNRQTALAQAAWDKEIEIKPPEHFLNIARNLGNRAKTREAVIFVLSIGRLSDPNFSWRDDSELTPIELSYATEHKRDPTALSQRASYLGVIGTWDDSLRRHDPQETTYKPHKDPPAEQRRVSFEASSIGKEEFRELVKRVDQLATAQEVMIGKLEVLIKLVTELKDRRLTTASSSSSESTSRLLKMPSLMGKKKKSKDPLAGEQFESENPKYEPPDMPHDYEEY
jgi:hypothetical protein